MLCGITKWGPGIKCGFSRFILTLIFTLLFSILIYCDQDKTPVQSIGFNNITLKTEYVGVTEARINVHLGKKPEYAILTLNRNSKLLFSTSIDTVDTVFHDTGLLPGETYTYQAKLGMKEKPFASSMPLTIKTTDTTSHNFTWRVDTIGAITSDLNDIWGTDPQNVYAVGVIRHEDSGWHSIERWDGSEWREYKYFWAILTGIFGNGQNDIMVVGDKLSYAFAAHWDGQQWTEYEMPQFPRLLAVWGSAQNDYYAVGWDGIILHFDGTGWAKMESGTPYPLYDVWGFENGDVYAAGTNVPGVPGILLKLNGNTWTTIIETGIYDPQSTVPNGRLSGIWGYDSDHLYVTGSTAYMLQDENWTKLNPPNSNTFMEKVGGNSSANVFISGNYGLLMHWNGVSWKRFPEFYNKPWGDDFKEICCFDHDVFVIVREASSLAYTWVIHGVAQ